jgi:hypothetical protein
MDPFGYVVQQNKYPTPWADPARPRGFLWSPWDDPTLLIVTDDYSDELQSMQQPCCPAR